MSWKTASRSSTQSWRVSATFTEPVLEVDSISSISATSRIAASIGSVIRSSTRSGAMPG